ncbi:nuclear transport factor 2 family protein [Kutzneria sp. CA-103260]|uniref:nuclear transport factor 2 family protein n=1 Tax=Kutzneria sp. CA-103260 TaxID=2802641 RepID=UPI001BAA0E03|nr:nuclear transport factor 2 family protein [Kutzneria sp. CA-103260]QUQ64147.1 SnoaL-like domain protein [Kutzneria sp. CA-103260]
MTGSAQDVVDVTQTVLRHFTTADANDFEAYRALLADEIEVDFGGVNDAGDGPAAAGRISADQLAASARDLVGPVELTQHQITNLIAEVNGDDATVTFYESALHVHRALGEDPDLNSWTVYGRGVHRLRRTSAGWKIVAAKLTPVHNVGNANLLGDVAALSR